MNLKVQNGRSLNLKVKKVKVKTKITLSVKESKAKPREKMSFFFQLCSTQMNLLVPPHQLLSQVPGQMTIIKTRNK